MKKLFLLPLIAVLAVMVSCSSDDDNNIPDIKNETFFGSLLLNNTVIADDAECSLTVIDDMAAVVLHDVQFAAAMPKMDISATNLDCVKTTDGYIITGKNVVPFAGETPMLDFMMSSVEASLSDGKFLFTATTSMGTISFTNALVKPEMPVGKSRSYKGNLVVGDFAKEVVVDVVTDQSGSTLDITINGAKFASNMPLELNISLRDIPFKAGMITTFVAENVLPYINNEPEPTPAFTFASVEGAVAATNLQFKARMADGLAAYVAGKEFVFEGSEMAEGN